MFITFYNIVIAYYKAYCQELFANYNMQKMILIILFICYTKHSNNKIYISKEEYNMLKSNLGHTMLDNKIKSVAELSRKVDISRETLRKIYNGQRLETVSFEIVVKLCDFFKCQIKDIIEYIPDENQTQE